MIISDVQLYEYELPLASPLKVKGENLKKRMGYIIEVSSANFVGYGEIAPLPGFSPDSLTEAKAQIKAIKPFLLSDPIPEGLEGLDGHFQDWLGNFSLAPAVNFGIEMAVLNLLANVRSITLKELLSETNHTHIPINGLLTGSHADILQQTEHLLSNGFKALKLKVGRSSIEEDIQLVRTVSEKINGQALLHLDANQAWELEEAVHFGNEVGLVAVDYIEEPFKDLALIPEFFHQTTIPVALDESLQKYEFKDIKGIEGVDVLVLKPSVLGGIEKTWKLLRDAKRLGLDTLISSIFESSVGLMTLANLAGCSFRNNAAGLDTAKWFQTCLLKEPLTIQRGKIDIGVRSIQKEDIQFDLLNSIDLS